MHWEFRELNGWTDINHQTMHVVEWGLLDSMKLKHKMKLWTNIKFSPNQYQRWFGVIRWHMNWDKWLEPVARYSTYYPSCFFYQSYLVPWNSSYLSIEAKWVLLPLKFDARKGSIQRNTHSIAAVGHIF
jgi:hypothetical protein